ncbi:MAG TPA: hypothetical protein VHV30_01685 [Polyangiaceae bacterium]|nr:hypothetical protein [Polyangiaceae bacterium]
MTRTGATAGAVTAIALAACSAQSPGAAATPKGDAAAADAGEVLGSEPPDAGDGLPPSFIPSTAGALDEVGDSGPGTVSVDDASSDADPSSAYAVTIASSTFTVPAGGEVYKCQDFANPFGGQAVDIDRYDLTMNVGSHHMLLFYKAGATDGSVIDCPQGGLMTGPYTFGAQSRTATLAYPAGIGAAVPGTMGFTVQMHYVNTSPTPITGQATVTMHVARPDTITQHAGVLNYVQTQFSIPPDNQPHVISATCDLTQDVNILSTGAHMHQRAQSFVAASGATMLYQTDVWDDPPSKAFAPPLQLAQGAPITWSCTYVNDTTGALTFGESALTNAMCNFSATFYPVADPSNPIVQCLQ